MKGNMGKRGQSFKNRVDYILKDDHEFISSNMVADKSNSSEITDEFKAISQFRNDIKKPVMHAFLSLPKGENLTSEKWSEIAKDYLSEMGMDINKHQYICVRHQDTENDHIHIVANRVGLDGSVWHGQHEIYKTISACERLEMKHSLTQTQGLKGSKADVSAPTKAEIEQALRTGEKPARIVLQNALQAAMLDKPDLEMFVERLQAVGIEPRFNVASTGNVAGCSFKVGNIAFKGSTLGKKFSWNTIKTKVKYDKDRDDELVRSFSARKEDESNSLGRSSVKSDGNDDRTVGADNGNTDRLSKFSAESELYSVRKNDFDIRKIKSSHRQASKNFRRTINKSSQVFKRAKSIGREGKKESSNKNSGYYDGVKHSIYGSYIGSVIDHAEAATNAAANNNIRHKSSSRFDRSRDKIEALRNRLGLKEKEEVKEVYKEDVKPYNKPSYIVEHENENKKLKSKLQKTKHFIDKKTSEKENIHDEYDNNRHKRPKI